MQMVLGDKSPGCRTQMEAGGRSSLETHKTIPASRIQVKFLGVWNWIIKALRELISFKNNAL